MTGSVLESIRQIRQQAIMERRDPSTLTLYISPRDYSQLRYEMMMQPYGYSTQEINADSIMGMPISISGNAEEPRLTARDMPSPQPYQTNWLRWSSNMDVDVDADTTRWSNTIGTIGWDARGIYQWSQPLPDQPTRPAPRTSHTDWKKS